FLKRKDAAHYTKAAIGASASTKVVEKMTELNAISFGVKNKENMTRDEWMFSWEIMMKLIHEYLHPDEEEEWRTSAKSDFCYGSLHRPMLTK
ncbi:hypothetical protein FRC07_012630, partial [Ceratobasidium sp. 392]